jgi:hypothetical protein
MSRRWYSHAGSMVYVGWDAQPRRFFLEVVAMCPRCGGTGEEPDSDDFCAMCQGEGIASIEHAAAPRSSMATLDELAAELARLGIPFPDDVRADLEADQRAGG